MSLTPRTDRTGPNYDNDDDDDDVEEDADGCDHLMMTQGDEMDKKRDTGEWESSKFEFCWEAFRRYVAFFITSLFFRY